MMGKKEGKKKGGGKGGGGSAQVWVKPAGARSTNTLHSHSIVVTAPTTHIATHDAVLCWSSQYSCCF